MISGDIKKDVPLAIKILAYYRHHPRPATIKELSRYLGKNTTNVRNILLKLERTGLIRIIKTDPHLHQYEYTNDWSGL